MTREEAIRWHQAIAASAGMISGALARQSRSRRLVQDVLSLLRPVVKEMEQAEATFAAVEKIERDGPPAETLIKRVRRKK